MHSTINYDKKFNIGDLFLYDEGSKNQDLGYIVSFISDNKDMFKVYWFNQAKNDSWKNDPYSEENRESITRWNKSYIFPVIK